MSKEPTIKTIKTIPVIREIEKKVMVVKKVKETIEVGLRDLTENDIDAIKELDIAKAVAVGFRTLYEQAMDLNRDLVETAKKMSEARKKSEPTLNTQPFNLNLIGKPKKIKSTGSGNTGNHLGQKVGVTSKYHYVFFDSTQECWKCNFESKCFKNEIQAALAADEYTRSNKDGKKRPLNKNEFKEVADAIRTK